MIEAEVQRLVDDWYAKHNIPHPHDGVAIVAHREKLEQERLANKEAAFWEEIGKRTKCTIELKEVSPEEMKELDKEFAGKTPIIYWDEMKFQNG